MSYSLLFTRWFNEDTGDICDIKKTNNYRPIALVTAMSKILEIIILDRIECCTYTSFNQLRFKSKHANDRCVYSLKNAIAYYKENNSPVSGCFLDASRAFDRVNYWWLFTNSLNGVLIVRLISYWCVTQQFCVKWSLLTSVYFTTSNGVRQGGILSPRLFTLYILVTRSENYDQSAHRKRKHYIP